MSQDVPVKIVGGTKFGRYSKISVEQTWNMIVSDDALVPYAGYKLVDVISNRGTGRGLFNSERLGQLIAVINNVVYQIDNNLSTNPIGLIDTFQGDVFIDENDAKQIAISDQKDIWIYDYSLPVATFQKATIDFTPGYIAFQNGYFISPSLGEPVWRLSDLNNGLSWPYASQNVGTFQTKPDNTVAAFRMPSKGNLLFVMGTTVTEAWTNTGIGLFPYQRSSQYNIDYGCLNPATIATSDQFAVWLGVNEKSGPVILVSDGGPPTSISDEGFDFKFSQLKFPEQSYGFLFKQDGHLIYQLTFYNEADNFSLIFDFKTKMLFNVSDSRRNCHIAKKVVFFNNSYYFISLIDGNLYEFSTKYNDLNGDEMPMIRITETFRLPKNFYYVINNLIFTIEQGVNPLNVTNVPSNEVATDYVITDDDMFVTTTYSDYVAAYDYSTNNNLENLLNFETNHLPTVPRIDLTISKDGGETFGNAVSKPMRPIGYRKNKLMFWNLGAANEVTFQIRFHGKQRFVAFDGVMSIYQ